MFERYIVMKKMQQLRHLLLAIYFGWFTAGGVILTAVVIWLTPLSLSVPKVILYGAAGGMMAAVGLGLLVVTLFWRKNGSAGLRGSLLWSSVSDVFDENDPKQDKLLKK